MFSTSESMPLRSSQPHTRRWHLPMSVWGSGQREEPVERKDALWALRHTCPSPSARRDQPHPTNSHFILILSPHKLLFCLDQLWSAFTRQNRNKKQHRFWHVEVFSLLNLLSKEKKKSSLFYRLLLFLGKKKKMEAVRNVTITDDISL